jgi:hypothetical protein
LPVAHRCRRRIVLESLTFSALNKINDNHERLTINSLTADNRQ